MLAGYTSEECELLSLALTQAWQHLSETGQSGDEAMDKAALSHSLLKAADLGERSQQVLVAYALAHLQEARLTIQRRTATAVSK